MLWRIFCNGDVSDAFLIAVIDVKLRRKARDSSVFLKAPLRHMVESWGITADAEPLARVFFKHPNVSLVPPYLSLSVLSGRR